MADTATTPIGLLRVSTAGSVDDGKSTLIGRLLYETKAVYDDQLAEAARASQRQGDPGLNLALLTDGLRAEREQGITIDVAYRYFTTPRRRFIVADTPGHAQYTRNMVTGMSTADAAIILVDAARGITEQSRRHALLTALLRVPQIIVCINKMDLVAYDEATFRRLEEAFGALYRRAGGAPITAIPLSSLHGDNVVERSPRMPWYGGPALLPHLEAVPEAQPRADGALRFPVQWVRRSPPGGQEPTRAYAGRIASGTLRAGDEVAILPSGERTRVRSIETAAGPIAAAGAPLSVAVTLDDDRDVARGDLLCRPESQPIVEQTVDALVCWFAQAPLRPNARYAIKHTTRNARAIVAELHSRLDVGTLAEEREVATLAMNEIGRVALRATVPLCYDPYADNRTTGSFILIDEHSHETVGAGMLLRRAG